MVPEIVTNHNVLCPECGKYLGGIIKADERGLYTECYSCKVKFDLVLTMERRPDLTAEGKPF